MDKIKIATNFTIAIRYFETTNLTYIVKKVRLGDAAFNIGCQSDNKAQAKEYSEKLAEFLGVPFESY